MGFGVKLTPHLLSVMFRTGFTLTAYVVLEECFWQGIDDNFGFWRFCLRRRIGASRWRNQKIMFNVRYLMESVTSIFNLQPVDNCAKVKTGVWRQGNTRNSSKSALYQLLGIFQWTPFVSRESQTGLWMNRKRFNFDCKCSCRGRTPSIHFLLMLLNIGRSFAFLMFGCAKLIK